MGSWIGGRGLASGREGRGSAGRVPPGPWRPGCLWEGAGQIGAGLPPAHSPNPGQRDLELSGRRLLPTHFPQTPDLAFGDLCRLNLSHPIGLISHPSRLLRPSHHSPQTQYPYSCLLDFCTCPEIPLLLSSSRNLQLCYLVLYSLF